MEYEIVIDGSRARWVVGYEGRYRVTECGKVISYATSNTKGIKGTVSRYGYNQIGLTDTATKQTTYLVHRLVATAFIPNPEGKCSIDHIDEDKLNNDISNLRWCTVQENIAYYRANHPTVPKEPEPPVRMYGTREDLIKAIGKEVRVNGTLFPSCGHASKWIVDQEALLGNIRKKETISKELRRYLQGRKSEWDMYGLYSISKP